MSPSKLAASVLDVTDQQIIDLQTEARAHGDSEMWRICQSALDGNQADREECEEAIQSGDAMLDEDALAADLERDRITVCYEYGVTAIR